MTILGSMFLGADCSFDLTPTSVNNLTLFELGKGEYDDIYCTEDTDLPMTFDIQKDWDLNTVFAGDYEDNIDLSNVSFSLSTISHLVIKKRKVNTFKWTTILVKRISTLDDLVIIGNDIFNAGNTDYQYALVPLLNNIEGGYSITEAHSDFNGIFLLEKDRIYGTILDTKCDNSRNHSVIIQPSLYNKYPRAIYNALYNYESGTAEGFFCRYDVNNCIYYPQDSTDYRRDFVDFLTDHKPKILKTFDGRIWLINISADSIQETEDGHYEHRLTSFSWTETGDCNDEQDLYDADLIDVDSAYWSYE